MYVGITNNVKRRFKQNGIEYKDSLFGKAIRKYGWNEFEHIILESGITKREAQYLEQLYIICLDAKVPGGYNLTNGGESNAGHKMSAESKMKISKIMSEMRKGIKFSDKHKQHLSKARVEMLKNKKKNGELLPALRKPVTQFTKDGKYVNRYVSAIEALNQTGIFHINAVCNGKLKSACGYIWRWV